METDEKQRHPRVLNERIREVTEDVLHKVEMQANTLTAQKQKGMMSYRQFFVDGMISIEPFSTGVPGEVIKRFKSLSTKIRASSVGDFIE